MKKGISLILLVAVVGGSFGYYMWNKPHENMTAAKADIEISSTDLFAQFSNDESAANTKFLDKTISVSGIVKESNNNKVNLDTGADAMFGVVCELDNLTKHPRTNFPVGEKVTLKCKCSGLNMDVQLSRCVEVK